MNGTGKIRKPHAKRMKLDYSFCPHTKINSKWIKDLNTRPETNNCMGKNIHTKLMNLGLREDFIQCPAQIMPLLITKS